MADAWLHKIMSSFLYQYDTKVKRPTLKTYNTFWAVFLIEALFQAGEHALLSSKRLKRGHFHPT